MASPLLSAPVWSTAPGALCAPFNTAIGKRLNSRGVSAPITGLIIACLVVVPTILVAGTLLNEVVRSAAPVDCYARILFTKLLRPQDWFAEPREVVRRSNGHVGSGLCATIRCCLLHEETCGNHR